VYFLFRWTSGEVSRLSTYAGEFDPRTEYHLLVLLWKIPVIAGQ